ncbi:hypothetical protein CK203_071766 [Vitis vinifera]|uniref:Uncharacterized protein n=1 Tax=Vitis vinifera TaxID=29760 RepID=A0A438C369_VITVI|nr:hypothetical protein CK203_071766 [Vitis vinifera]
MMQLSQCTWTFPELLKRPAFLRRSIDSISSRSRSSSKYPSFMASASTVSAPNTEAEQTHNPPQPLQHPLLKFFQENGLEEQTSGKLLALQPLWWLINPRFGYEDRPPFSFDVLVIEIWLKFRAVGCRTIIYILLWWMVMSTLPITLLTPTWTYLSMVSEASNCAGAFCTSRALLGFCVVANLIMHC